MGFPLGKKGVVAAGAVLGALAFWRVRAKKREQEDLEWEAEVADAIQEGRTGAETPAGGEGS